MSAGRCVGIRYRPCVSPPRGSCSHCHHPCLGGFCPCATCAPCEDAGVGHQKEQLCKETQTLVIALLALDIRKAVRSVRGGSAIHTAVSSAPCRRLWMCWRHHCAVMPRHLARAPTISAHEHVASSGSCLLSTSMPSYKKRLRSARKVLATSPHEQVWLLNQIECITGRVVLADQWTTEKPLRNNVVPGLLGSILHYSLVGSLIRPI